MIYVLYNIILLHLLQKCRRVQKSSLKSRILMTNEWVLKQSMENGIESSAIKIFLRLLTSQHSSLSAQSCNEKASRFYAVTK